MTRVRLNSPFLAALFAACYIQVTGAASAAGGAMISGYDEKKDTVAPEVAEVYP